MLKAMLALLLIFPGIAPLYGQKGEIIERESHEIRGGIRPDDYGQFRFNAYIDFERGEICSGSVIAPRWVFTAAHCVTRSDGSVIPVTDIYRITVSNNTDQVEQYNGSDGHLKRIVVHPDYDFTGAGFKNDAALIELTSSYGARRRPPPTVRILSPQEEARLAPSGTLATIMGMGRTEQRFTEVTLYQARDCHEAFDIADETEVVHDRTLCAGIPEDPSKGTEPGDSGGMVLVPIRRLFSGEVEWGQVGILSMSGSDANGERIVSVATRIASIYTWIKGTITSRVILTHVFSGPLSNALAETEITITNRTQEPCRASVRFHRGTEEAPAVRFNGQYLDGNRMEIDMEGGTVHRVLLTVDPGQDLAVGAAYVEHEAGCSAGDLQVEGRYLITDREGQIREVFSVLPQTDSDWLSDGECRLLSNRFGSRDNIGRDNIGLAMVTAQPEEAAPSGTKMTFEAYDWQGNFVEEPPSLEVTGAQHALNPWEFSEPRLVKLCLDVPDDQPTGFRLSLISIAARVSSRNVQYYSSALIRP